MQENKSWWKWEPKIRDRDAAALEELRSTHTRAIDIFIATQLIFDMQWGKVKVRATLWFSWIRAAAAADAYGAVHRVNALCANAGVQ